MAGSKKKKNKKLAKLLVLSGVFVLFLVGYLAISQYNKLNQEEPVESTEAEEILPISVSTDLVSKVELVSKDIQEEENRIFTYDAETEVWVCAENTHIPIRQSTVKGVVRNSASVTALQVVSEDFATDAASFGLAEPAHTVTLTMTDGNTKTLYIGSKALTGDYYYFAVEGDNQIYLIANTLVNYATRTFYDFVDAPKYPTIEENNMISVTYQDADTDLQVYYNPSDLLLVDAMSISMWYYPLETEGRYTSAGYDQAQEFVKAVTGIYFSECVKYGVTEDMLAQYGLDAPQATLTVNYNLVETSGTGEDAQTTKTPTEITVYIGSSFEDEAADMTYYYVMMNDVVYTCGSEAGVNFLLNTYEMDYMLNRWPCQTNIAIVDTIDVTFGGVTKELKIEGKVTTDESGKETTTYTFYVDGELFDEGTFRDFYSVLIMPEADKIISPEKANPDSEVLLDYAFHTNVEGEPPKTVTIGTYDDTYYQLALNGEVRYLLTRVEAKEILAAAETFFQGSVEE